METECVLPRNASLFNKELLRAARKALDTQITISLNDLFSERTSGYSLGEWTQFIQVTARGLRYSYETHSVGLPFDVSQASKIRLIRAFVHNAANSPRFRERLRFFVEQAKFTSLSPKEFFAKNQDRFAEFQILLSAAESEFSDIISELGAVLEIVTDTVWNCLLRLADRWFIVSRGISHNSTNTRKQNLWPTLMAFKNA